jgi:hypothetical protein
MRRLLLLAAVVLALAGCGGGDGKGVFQRAEAGLRHVRTVEARVVVHALVPVERSATLEAADVPLTDLHIARWAKDPHRVDCDAELDCGRADLDVEAALRELEPVLPSLPLDPGSIRSAEIQVAVGKDDGRPRRLTLEGDLDPGFVPGTVRFEAELAFS